MKLVCYQILTTLLQSILPTGIGFRIIGEKNLLCLAEALQKQPFTSFSLDQHFALVCYLCDDLLDLDLVREVVLVTKVLV